MVKGLVHNGYFNVNGKMIVQCNSKNGRGPFKQPCVTHSTVVLCNLAGIYYTLLGCNVLTDPVPMNNDEVLLLKWDGHRNGIAASEYRR